MDTKEIFRMRLRTARTELGLSQKALAEKIGVRRAMVSDWEQGRFSPQMDRFTDICNALEKPLVYFFSASENDGDQFMSNAEIVEDCKDTIQHLRKMRRQLLTMYAGLGMLIDVFGQLQVIASPGDHGRDKMFHHILQGVEGLDADNLSDDDIIFFRKTLSSGLVGNAVKQLGLILEGRTDLLSFEDSSRLKSQQGEEPSMADLVLDIRTGLEEAIKSSKSKKGEDVR